MAFPVPGFSAYSSNGYPNPQSRQRSGVAASAPSGPQVLVICRARGGRPVDAGVSFIACTRLDPSWGLDPGWHLIDSAMPRDSIPARLAAALLAKGAEDADWALVFPAGLGDPESVEYVASLYSPSFPGMRDDPIVSPNPISTKLSALTNLARGMTVTINIYFAPNGVGGVNGWGPWWSTEGAPVIAPSAARMAASPGLLPTTRAIDDAVEAWKYVFARALGTAPNFTVSNVAPGDRRRNPIGILLYFYLPGAIGPIAFGQPPNERGGSFGDATPTATGHGVLGLKNAPGLFGQNQPAQMTYKDNLAMILFQELGHVFGFSDVENCWTSVVSEAGRAMYLAPSPASSPSGQTSIYRPVANYPFNAPAIGNNFAQEIAWLADKYKERPAIVKLGGGMTGASFMAPATCSDWTDANDFWSGKFYKDRDDFYHRENYPNVTLAGPPGGHRKWAGYYWYQYLWYDPSGTGQHRWYLGISAEDHATGDEVSVWFGYLDGINPMGRFTQTDGAETRYPTLDVVLDTL